MIRRSYSPPFQAASPQPGMGDAGRAVKGLVTTEIARSTEISFALESFGCDGKPVLSLLRDLPCETTGKLTVAGTKNGMPFALNSDLPRGLGSAIRGAGGGLRQVSSTRSFRAAEWVLYDSVGNYWSLDELTGGAPTYRGETPRELNSNVTAPALCVQNPRIRPYEKRWELETEGGDPPAKAIEYRWAGCGWIHDPSSSPVIAYPVAFPYAVPSDYWRIEQWIPDETTPPPGGATAGAWPSSHRHVECEWYPARTDTPFDWRDEPENSIDVIVSKYLNPDSGVWWSNVYMNRWTRPLLEHISVGAIPGEDIFLICVEKDLVHFPFGMRVALRRSYGGELLGSAVISALPEVGRVMFTPNKGEGWLMQTGAISGATVTLRQFRSRATTTADFGSALSECDPVFVTLPDEPAHPWTADPVWFRVGRVTRILGGTPTLSPRLPLWR